MKNSNEETYRNLFVNVSQQFEITLHRHERKLSFCQPGCNCAPPIHLTTTPDRSPATDASREVKGARASVPRRRLHACKKR